MRTQIQDFLLLTGVGGGFFTVVSKSVGVDSSYNGINWGEVVAIVTAIAGTYLAWRGLNISRAQYLNDEKQKQEEALNKKLNDVRDDFAIEINSLRSVITNSFDRNADLINNCLDKMTVIMSDLKAHTLQYYGHQGVADEIKKIEEKIDRLSVDINQRPRDEVLLEIRELKTIVNELGQEK